MNWRHYLLLALLGLAVSAAMAAFQPAPDYMDADYYFATGLQLATGHGFTEPFLWNYLDDPAGLPHPSHAYWMPLASLLAAVIPALSGHLTWFAGRIPFLLAAALIPPLTAALAFSLTSRYTLALTSGLLAVFSGYYAPFLPVTDTFGLYMLLGGLFFLLVKSRKWNVGSKAFVLGTLAGLMHLARADGILWLFIALISILIVHRSSSILGKPASSTFTLLTCLLLVTLSLFGYFLVMSPWFARNLAVFGTPLAPGGSRALWLTHYDQLFAYPASQLTFDAWLASGAGTILKARVWALGLNLANTLAVQGEVFLLPLILIGIWHFRKDCCVQLAALVWMLTFLAMTLVFPFAGARGGFFHSSAALQPVWWALAPVGLERAVDWAERRRGRPMAQARVIFRGGAVALAALLTVVIVQGRVIGGFNGEQAWGQRDAAYSQIEHFIVSKGAKPETVVIVANPPGYFVATDRSAIAIPDGNVTTLLAVAERYGAQYLILEAGHVPVGLQSLYEQPDGYAGLRYLGEVEAARVFAIQP